MTVTAAEEVVAVLADGLGVSRDGLRDGLRKLAGGGRVKDGISARVQRDGLLETVAALIHQGSASTGAISRTELHRRLSPAGVRAADLILVLAELEKQGRAFRVGPEPGRLGRPAERWLPPVGCGG